MIPLDRNPLYALSMDAFNYCMDIAQPRVALDIGANEGGYTHIMVQKGLEVYAYEPVPDMFDRLFARHADNGRVHCQRVAVSDKRGMLNNVTVLCAWTLGKPGDGGLSQCPQYVGRGLSSGQGKDEIPGGYFNVDTIRIDDQFYPNGVGLVKLDVDGYEMKALKGMAGLLAKWKPPILCEFSCWIEKLGTPAEQFVQWIVDHGYNMVSMDGKRCFTSWNTVADCYPHDTSFDVMLLPREKTLEVLKHFGI